MQTRNGKKDNSNEIKILLRLRGTYIYIIVRYFLEKYYQSIIDGLCFHRGLSFSMKS